MKRFNIKFQPTRPHGARLWSISIYIWISCFNPRARMGRDGSLDLSIYINSNSFNPRARMGRDQLLAATRPKQVVSTHAPAWGATKLADKSDLDLYSFNPRARMGRDMLMK